MLEHRNAWHIGRLADLRMGQVGYLWGIRITSVIWLVYRGGYTWLNYDEWQQRRPGR